MGPRGLGRKGQERWTSLQREEGLGAARASPSQPHASASWTRPSERSPGSGIRCPRLGETPCRGCRLYPPTVALIKQSVRSMGGVLSVRGTGVELRSEHYPFAGDDEDAFLRYLVRTWAQAYRDMRDKWMLNWEPPRSRRKPIKDLPQLEIVRSLHAAVSPRLLGATIVPTVIAPEEAAFMIREAEELRLAGGDAAESLEELLHATRVVINLSTGEQAVEAAGGDGVEGEEGLGGGKPSPQAGHLVGAGKAGEEGGGLQVGEATGQVGGAEERGIIGSEPEAREPQLESEDQLLEDLQAELARRGIASLRVRSEFKVDGTVAPNWTRYFEERFQVIRAELRRDSSGELLRLLKAIAIVVGGQAKVIVSEFLEEAKERGAAETAAAAAKEKAAREADRKSVV